MYIVHTNSTVQNKNWGGGKRKNVATIFDICRVEKYILEQIEALEDKVAAASMQVPVSVS